MKSDFVELVLNCSSWQEAQRITDAVLEQHLVACVESIPIKSKYWWKRKLEETDEIKLIMQSVATNFAKIEAVVRELHSYETPNLRSIPIGNVTEEIATWLNDNARIEE